MKSRKSFWFSFLIIVCLIFASCGGKKGKSDFSQVPGVDKSGNYENVVRFSNKDKNKLRIFCPDLDVPEGSSDKSGDCIVVISPDDKVMLIDCGHPASVKYVLSILSDLNVAEIDCLVATHPHIDHIGGIAFLCKALKVKKCYYTGLSYPTQTYKNFTDAIEKFEIPLEIIRDGDSFQFGKKVKCEILWPLKGEFEYPAGYPANSTQFVNDTSVCLKMTFGSSSAVFAGDLYRSAERKLLELHKNQLKCDLAKANHHGNDTSNSLGWIKALDAKVVFAMNDVIGSMQVYKDYTKNGTTRFYHSSENGVMKFCLDGKGNVFAETQKTSWMQKN